MILIHLFYILFLLLGLILVSLYFLSDLLASFKGAPYVPSKSQDIESIFEKIKLKKGQSFLELGSGDGRVTRYVVKKFGAKGLGVDLNPLLVLYSNLISKISHPGGVIFKTGDIFKLNFKQFGVVFLFLMPRTVERLKEKFELECQKGTIIISHGFEIKGWQKRLVKKIPRKTFPTFIYKL